VSRRVADSLLKLAVAETSFVERMTSHPAPASDVIMALSPPLCHSSPATGARSPRYQYGSAAPGVAMTTFRRDDAQTGNGGRLAGDDVSRCQLHGGVETQCETCAATRYCACCCNQPSSVYAPRVADV